MSKRICNECKSDKTHVNKKGSEVWSRDKWTGKEGHVCNLCANRFANAANREKRNAAKRKAHQENRGGIADRARVASEKRREDNPEARAEYYEANKERERETQRVWRKMKD